MVDPHAGFSVFHLVQPVDKHHRETLMFTVLTPLLQTVVCGDLGQCVSFLLIQCVKFQFDLLAGYCQLVRGGNPNADTLHWATGWGVLCYPGCCLGSN